MRSARSYNYCSIWYPESGFDLDSLADGLPSVIASPLHDSDLNESGETKKSHRHLIVHFSSLKTLSQAKLFFSDTFNSVGCEPVLDLNSYVRYLCHLDGDDKSKSKYNPKDCLIFGAPFKWERYFKTPAPDLENALLDIQLLIDEFSFCSYAELARYIASERPELLKTLVKNTSHFRTFLQACVWEKTQ